MNLKGVYLPVKEQSEMPVHMPPFQLHPVELQSDPNILLHPFNAASKIENSAANKYENQAYQNSQGAWKGSRKPQHQETSR